jgi:hypothetical protein
MKNMDKIGFSKFERIISAGAIISIIAIIIII